MTEKTALIERLVRLGATDVPGTDRWVMRHRSPAELAQLQHGVEAGIGKLQAPFKAGLEKVVSPLPGKLQGAARAVGNAAIDNPEIALPGGSLAVIGKKALEKVIDRVAPLAKTGFAVSQYSGPLNPDIRSGASGLPPFRVPRLGAAVQKTAFATTYSAGPSPDWAHDAAPPSGASSLPPRRAPRLDVAVQKTAAAELEFFLLKVSTDANMGQWWEQKGGPHLAKGGSHKEFRKMMDKEKFPDHVKKKFMDVAAKKYPQGHNEPGGGQRHWSSWSAPRAAKPSGIMGHIAKHPVAAGLAASAGIVGAGYLADRIGDHLEKRKKEHEPKQKAAAVDEENQRGFGTGEIMAGAAGRTAGGMLATRGARSFVGDIAKDANPDLMKRVRSAAAVPIIDTPEFDNAAFVNKPAANVMVGARNWIKKQPGGAGALRDIPGGMGHVVENAIPEPHVQMGGRFNSPSVLAHELGHSDVQGKWWGGAAQHPITGAVSKGLSGPIGAISGGLTGALTDDPRKKALGIGLPALLHLPMLASEAGASLYGMGRLRGARATPEQLQHARTLLTRAFSTYGGKAIRDVGTAALAQGVGTAARRVAKGPTIEPQAQKMAAGAPTRGNFMMASDIPSYRPPRLDRAIQKAGELETEPRVDIFKGAAPKKEEPKKVKAGDMLPDYVTYSPNDFKRSKYAMPTEKLAEYVEGLLKEAIPGLTPQSRLEQSSGIGAPRAAAPAAPGPSIADQAKPKGPGFGTGIAGANKGTIGGTNVGGIGNMAAVPQL